jgi:hypothetical protein
MDILKETRFVERLQFFNGQRLFASDVQGVEAFNREMRWLHNQSLHQPGIGNGFAVSGKKSDREVEIGPGYAIDALGREIVLTQSESQPVPPVAAEVDGTPVLFDLVVSYPDDQFLEATESRQGVCSGPGVTRLKEEPIFCWVRLNANGQPQDADLKRDILARMRIVLARAAVLNCQLNDDVSIAQRISARPSKQPYICCGTVLPDWQRWEITPFVPSSAISKNSAKALQSFSFFPFILPVGLQADIDTSECGFLTTPCYTARIEGPRVRQFAVASEATTNVTAIIDGLIQIVQPAASTFRINVLLLAQFFIQSGGVIEFLSTSGGGSSSDQMDEIIALLSNDWSVVWMGVEG